MIQTIQTLSKFFNGSGSEMPLSEFLLSEFQKAKIDAYIDPMGSVVAKFRGVKSAKEKIMITCPIDVPCLLTLYVEKNKAFLAKIGRDSFQPKAGALLSDEKGNVHKLKKSPYDENGWFVSGKGFSLGDAFRENVSIEEKENRLVGRFAAKYALMALLYRLSESKPKCDLVLCFSSGFETDAKSEANVAFREKPNMILLLNAEDSREKAPALVLKDGKRFSDEVLIEKIKDLGYEFRTTVHPSPLTKAETIFFPSDAKIATIAIPAENLGKENETVSLCSLKQLEESILAFIAK